MGEAYSTNREKRNAYRILVGKPERKTPLARPRHRWVDNIVTCTPLIRLVLVRMIGLIIRWLYTHS
jgi:hypothetical protein